jgi:hypothetical protein
VEVDIPWVARPGSSLTTSEFRLIDRLSLLQHFLNQIELVETICELAVLTGQFGALFPDDHASSNLNDDFLFCATLQEKLVAVVIKHRAPPTSQEA